MTKQLSHPPDPPFGFLICDKPVHMTSRDAVNIVANRFWETRVAEMGDDSTKPKKIKFGHAGTLDPLAEGVLVIGVGSAVRLVSHVQDQPKHYRSTFLLGQETQSGDLEVPPTIRDELPIPSEDSLRQAAKQMIGTITQIPPAHSAIKVKGRRAYDRVRSGEQVEMPERRVEIHSLEITRYDFPEIDLEIDCGSGTYIRTLGMDLAKATGTVGVMKCLRRIAVGRFTESDAVGIDQIRQQDPRRLMVPALWAVDRLPKFEITDEQATRLVHGLELDIAHLTFPPKDDGFTTGQSAAVWRDKLLAILHHRGGRLWPSRVFPNSDVPKTRHQSSRPS